jgi:hypothetical protein
VPIRHAGAARPIERYIDKSGIELAEEIVKGGVRFPVLVRDGRRIPFFAVRLTHPKPVPLYNYLAEIGRQLAGPRVPGETVLEGRSRTEFHLRILLGTSRFQSLATAFLEAQELDQRIEREQSLRESQLSYAL